MGSKIVSCRFCSTFTIKSISFLYYIAFSLLSVYHSSPLPLSFLFFLFPLPFSLPSLFFPSLSLLPSLTIPLASRPTYEIMTLSLHEGNPGHHLQGSHSLESSSMPFFRRVMEDRNYYQAPSRFPMNTGFLEGWGLYSESLGFDLGLFGDPYDRYVPVGVDFAEEHDAGLLL